MRMLRVQEVSAGAREIAILGGYRPEQCSLLQCASLMFRASNETVNVWTHLLAALYFGWNFLGLAPGAQDPTLQPFLGYLATATTYLLVSSFAHALACLSPHARHVCYCLDYAALSIFSFGVAVLYSAYSFPPWLQNCRWTTIYLTISILLSIACTFLACISRLAEDICMQKVLRIGAFVLPYVWVNAPLMLRLVSGNGKHDTAWALHTGQFVAMGLAAFFYGTHIPERLAPGHFDFIGHSHNLLHICGTAATAMQMRAGIMDMASLTDHHASVCGLGTVASVAAVNMGLVALFIAFCPKHHLKDK